MVNKIDIVFISGRTLSAAIHLSIWSSLPEKIMIRVYGGFPKSVKSRTKRSTPLVLKKMEGEGLRGGVLVLYFRLG